MAFMIVGKDRPVYELIMSGSREDLARQAQFILHSALDMVELSVYANPATCVRSFNLCAAWRWEEFVAGGGEEASERNPQYYRQRAVEQLIYSLQLFENCGSVRAADGIGVHHTWGL